MFGAIAGGGAAVGLLLGGVLTEYAYWRWCLLVNIPIALIAASPGSRRPREQGARRHPYDVPGALAGHARAWRAGLRLHPGAEPQRAGCDLRVTLGFLGSPSRCWWPSWWWRRGPSNPLLPLRIVLDRNRGGAYLVFLLIGAGLFGDVPVPDLLLPVILGYRRSRPGSRSCRSASASHGRRVSPQAAAPVRSEARDGPRAPLAVLGMLLVTRIGAETSFTPTSCRPSCS